jgi:hypothetical protein
MEKRPIVVKILVVVVLLGALCFVVGAYAKWRAHESRTNAEITLRRVRSLRPGDASLVDVEALARIQNRFLKVEFVPQKHHARYFDFRYDNALLSRLHLAPPVVFTVRLFVQGGSLAATGASLDCGPYPSLNHHGASLQELSRKDDLEDRKYDLTQSNLGIIVRLWHGATQDQVRRAYAFNLSYLDRIGTCQSDNDLWLGNSGAREKAE